MTSRNQTQLNVLKTKSRRITVHLISFVIPHPPPPLLRPRALPPPLCDKCRLQTCRTPTWVSQTSTSVSQTSTSVRLFRLAISDGKGNTIDNLPCHATLQVCSLHMSHTVPRFPHPPFPSTSPFLPFRLKPNGELILFIGYCLFLLFIRVYKTTKNQG